MNETKMNAAIHWQNQMHFECINNFLNSHIDETADFVHEGFAYPKPCVAPSL
jgi:hypothetical protein